MKKFFITSTGTGIGKTFLTCLLTEELLERKYKVDSLKPIISGFGEKDKTTDTAKILNALGKAYNKENIDKVSLYKFEEPTSPDICSRKTGIKIKIKDILKFIKEREKADFQFIEGVGGVMVPLNEKKLVIDLIKKIKAPVILVSGDYLGTLSHTLTAINALKQRKIKISAIVISESEVNEKITFLEIKKSLNNFSSAKVLWLPRKPDKKEKKQFINSFLNVIS